MKHLLPILLLTFTVVFIDQSIEADSLALIVANIQSTGKDSAPIAITEQPVWTKKTGTQVAGYIVSIPTGSLGKFGWKDAPLAQVEAMVTKDVRPPDKQKVTVMTREELREDYNPPTPPEPIP